MKRRIQWGLLALCLTWAGQSVAQDYPNKTIRIIAPFPAGTGPDANTREIAAELTKVLGQTVVVENRPGASNMIGMEAGAKAPADGYTLVMGSTTSLSVVPHLYGKVPYKVGDFTPISNVVETAFLLLTHPSLQANNARELAALAKARPGQLSYASFGPASSAHLAGELFSIAAGLKMIHVPYKGSAAATTDLMAGHTQLMFDSLQSSLTHVRSKRLRAIAYAGAKRSRVAPSVPTMAESGFPDVIAGSWYGVLAPANTPSAIITRLHAEIVKAANAPDVRERLENVGVDVIATTPQEFAAAIKSDLDRWSKVVKQANIRLD